MAAPDPGTGAAVGADDDVSPTSPNFQHQPEDSRSADDTSDDDSGEAHDARDPDHTPRSETQPAESNQTPWQSIPPTHCTSDLPYHSPRPVRYHTAYLPRSSTASVEPFPSPTNSSSTSLNKMAGHGESSGARDPQRLQQQTPERPAFRRDNLSSTSTTSNATVRAPSVSEPTMPPLARPQQRPQKDAYPHYPNQSYVVLQTQEEFMRYPNPPLQAHQAHPPVGPHLLRTRSSHPSHYSSCSTSSTGLHPVQYSPLVHVATHEHGIRTAGNSPATSPGLFDFGHAQPIKGPILGPSEEHGYYSSPYLHFTQRQVPKETHVADVDVDPISGRKIINQYEIIDELGRGVHGKVKLGRSLETGQFVAIKIVDRYSKRRRLGKNTSHEDKIRKEIAILKKARHPNIVGLLEVIDDPSRKKVYIVLEHVELGEVRWRTEGAREIVLIEHRRYEREARGIFDNESAALEDQRILMEARRRRERQEKRRLRRLHRQREKGSGPESWSFEYGGDTEDEDSDSEQLSRTSTATNDDPHGTGVKSSRATSPTDLDAEMTPHAPLNERLEELRESKQSSASLPALAKEPIVEQPRSQSVTGLEGTMYGAYDPSPPPRGRNASIAGSSSSNNIDSTENLDIPEHFRYVPLMTLNAARNAFRDTVLGLEYLHYQGVVHRDIKPANLLQSRDNRIKISDFGVSYLGRRTAAATGDDQSESDAQDVDEAIELAKTVGTPAFYAPELCQTDADADALPVTGQIDVWALGVTLYCLVFGRVPFHDLNTFVVMRLIAEDEVYIPRFRLRAVDDRSGSRPGSHNRFFNPMTSNKRAPHDLVYEEVEDDLYDLLKRLLIKDPRKRITLREVKHHPWVLRDIADPLAWLDETDPSRETQGKKIEVSPNDVENAVVQLNLLERVKSGMRKLGGALGIGSGSKSYKQSRERSKTGEGGVSSAASSSSTISQDARRPSLKVDDTIFAALRASRESDHPLSKSLTATPEFRERAEFFIGPNSRPDTPDNGVDDDVKETIEKHDRLSFAERASQSSMSTAGSVRTLRQSDFVTRRRGASPTMPQGVPGTPLALDTPTASNLSGIFGGAGRRILRTVRSKDRGSLEQRTPGHSRATSIDRWVAGEEVDPHGEPSVALSGAVAAGHVDPPAIPREGSTASSSVTSPASPVSHSTDARPISRDGMPSRQSSISSTSSHRPRKQFTEEERMYSSSAMQDFLDERFNRARDENRRRRIMEEHAASRPGSAHGPRPPSSLSQAPCPPSPDDEIFYQQQKQKEEEESFSRRPSLTPRGYPIPLTSSSSEDQFFSGVSQSTSNPSLPSIVSANSSIMQEDLIPPEQVKELPEPVKPQAPTISVTEDHEGYDGDHAVESDDEDDSSDDDFIEMNMKRKPPAHRYSRSESISNAQLSRIQVRPSVDSSIRKSSRSGSNGTVKRVRSHSGSDLEIIHHDRA